MSEVDARYVKRGFWINVEQGPVLGRTLTVDIKTGTMIIALVAVLSSLAMTHLWHLFAFSYHQYRANGRPGDALFQQQQVLLRTLSPPGAFVADSIKLWWVWRKKNISVFKRFIAQPTVAMLFTAATVVVGIFSSNMANSTNLQVLVKSPSCRTLDIDPTAKNFTENFYATAQYMQNIVTRSQPFADECYQFSDPKLLPARCTAFIRPNIALPAERVMCPFDAKVCAAKDHGVSVDSGIVDGNYIFGWNINRKDRVKYRRKVTCGVLQYDGYTKIMNGSDFHKFKDYVRRPVLPGEQIELKQYGTGKGQNFTMIHSLLQGNTTIVYTKG